MSLGDDLQKEVRKFFLDKWTTREGRQVPESDDIQLGNDAVLLDGAVLYADLADSTILVDTHTQAFAAEIYKAFLHCAAKIISSESGTITAYDGDRVMAVYIGDSKRTQAARSALKIHYAVRNIVQPLVDEIYPSKKYQVRHKVGVDRSDLFVARTGIRGANDLVWVGRAANHAAKLAALAPDPCTRITADVYDSMHESLRTTDGKAMWQSGTWNGATIYTSTWWWKV